MTDQPTDHRAEALAYLLAANDTRPALNEGYGGTIEQHLDAITEALVGIGHALLAQQADAWDDGYRNGYSIGSADSPTARTNYENPHRPPEPLDPTGFPLRAGRQYGDLRYDQVGDYVTEDE